MQKNKTKISLTTLLQNCCCLLMLGTVPGFLAGCAVSDPMAEEQNAEQLTAEEQLKQLQDQLATMKVEWDTQKPALERIVSNEADLEFLIKALSEMSPVEEGPSHDQFSGANELTPEKRQESLNALQTMVTNQAELNRLLLDLTVLVTEIKTSSGNSQSQVSVSENPSSDPDGIQPSAETMSVSQGGGQNETTMLATESTADCNCTSDSSSSSDTSAYPAGKQDSSWFAMTTPLPEARSVGGSNSGSQLDGELAKGGQPIPGLAVKSYTRRSLPSEMAAVGVDMQQYSGQPAFNLSRKSLSDYVAQLAFKLAGNQQLNGNKIGVTSFVFFDDRLDQTSTVGNQLAEELSTVLPGYGALVVEYKLTREISVSPAGDFSLSRNTQKLSEELGMDYVLTGTMVPTRRGLQIHGRVVSTRNNVVIASATTLIPALVLQHM